MNSAPLFLVITMKIEKPTAFQPPQTESSSVERQVRDVAKLYEGQFLRELVRQMRGTVPDSGLIEQSMGEKIYREELDNQYVESWVNEGGIGLADLIYDQILEKYGAQIKPAPPGSREAPGAQNPSVNPAARSPQPKVTVDQMPPPQIRSKGSSS